MLLGRLKFSFCQLVDFPFNLVPFALPICQQNLGLGYLSYGNFAATGRENKMSEMVTIEPEGAVETTVETQLIHERPLLKVLIGFPTVLSVVLINSVVVLLVSLPVIRNSAFNPILLGIDYICSIYFVIEAVLKIRLMSFRGYWKENWNKLDFIVVLSTIPILLNPLLPAHLEAFSFVSLLRVGRFLRFYDRYA